MVRAYSVASIGRPFYGTLTRGDAYALPRANRFWAFSPRVQALCQSPLSFYQTNIVCHRTLQNSRYLQTILSRKTNDPTPGMGKSVKRDSFNQTMFNQFIILLDYLFLCSVFNYESINSARKVSKVKPYALCACRKVKLSQLTTSYVSQNIRLSILISY